MAPAKVIKITIDEDRKRTEVVVVLDIQLSIVIGKNGGGDRMSMVSDLLRRSML